ncbi:hypothetical protein EH165_04735 [Nakamurella antarctica]|uniref:4-hydroxybenzoate polyprenyltransferase n=1 Tax=Nakamurella antarctica TaxID=1902245 RepID=A0A3G8ZK44_9ACTN|nr:UbiA family prenyltransferase [Nakamurella antarctica]AZI57570.1 hypothetical protein EH165_04735 [Nakamurella antarctica]
MSRHPLLHSARLLALSSHPLPTCAVTVFAGGLGLLAGNSIARSLLIAVCVLAGQLSIGWSNDFLDRGRDAAVLRADKPVALGEVSSRLVLNSAIAAAVLALLLPLTLGIGAAGAAWVIVISGWGYNLGLKATVFSFLPYVTAFGALPAIATLALADHAFPVWWAWAAGSLLGVAAHFANVLPDLLADEATGVRGLPHRLGARGSAIVGPLLLVAATGVLLLGPSTSWSWWRLVILAAVGAGAVVGAVVGVRRPGRRPLFAAMIAVCALDLLLFAVSGGTLR